ncbi:hypothetical protein J3Q64DRAFT_1757655, partial [Phycomyces blakesleeanus]
MCLVYHAGMQTHRRRSSKSVLLPCASPNVAGQIYARRMTVHLPETLPDTTYLWGYFLLISTWLIFFITMYSLIGSHWMPVTNNKVLDWIRDDDYYCYVVPVTAVVFIYFVVCNWMGMKFFRH